jgi:hypothetical protein
MREILHKLKILMKLGIALKMEFSYPFDTIDVSWKALCCGVVGFLVPYLSVYY